MTKLCVKGLRVIKLYVRFRVMCESAEAEAEAEAEAGAGIQNQKQEP